MATADKYYAPYKPQVRKLPIRFWQGVGKMRIREIVKREVKCELAMRK